MNLRSARRLIEAVAAVVLCALAVAGYVTAATHAAPASRARTAARRSHRRKPRRVTGTIGVNVKPVYDQEQYWPRDLSLARGAGARVVRLEAQEGTNMDGILQWLADAHMRLYPVIGIACPPGTASCTPQTQIPPATAAAEISQYITAFARRYGPHGTFWAQNPRVPYLPVQRFEIGNEPNLRMIWVQDGTHLHWADPSDPLLADYHDYAEVYEAARSALHKVDPSGVAVVGGLADSASYGVDVESDEALLSALPRGGVDAVGYHPWVYDVSDSLLDPDTVDLRVWMHHHGFAHVPIDVNELGACGELSSARDTQSCPRVQSSAAWGSAAAHYAAWALCTPWLAVKDLQPFVWGGTPVSDQDIWLPLITSGGSQTPFGHDFLSAARRLSVNGCPRTASAPTRPPHEARAPTIRGIPEVGRRLTVRVGRWTGRPRPKLSYQWLRCDHEDGGCISIAGAIAASYVVRSADNGTRIALLVTAINPSGGATATTRHTRIVTGG